MNCPFCGEYITNGDLICPHCGADLSSYYDEYEGEFDEEIQDDNDVWLGWGDNMELSILWRNL